MSNNTYLIADDDLGDRMATKRMLRMIDPTAVIEEYDGGPDSVMEFRFKPDIAFVDYNMPRCSGLDLIEELRRRSRDVACILMTGQGDEEIAKNAIRSGAYDYIAKDKLTEQPFRRLLEGAQNWRKMQLALSEQQQETELFAAVLLHDVKAPVRSIRFFAQEIHDSLPEESRALVAEELRLLSRSTNQIGSLLESLTNHMRISRDDPVAEHPVADLFETALAGLDRTVAEAGAAVRVDTDGTMLCCSKAQIVQMLQNLIVNAIKYGPPRGCDVLLSGATVGTDRVVLTVADNGPGIDPKYHESIFEPFKRGASQSQTEGTGLGLATCAKVARRHGGTIRCESALGEGSRFIVDLARTATPGDARAIGR